MSQLHGTGGHPGPSSTGAGSDRHWPDDNIVDVDSGGSNPELSGASTAPAETGDEEDVPLGIQLTDALSMLADGGHDYGSYPVVPEDDLDADDLDVVVIDESSKDA